MDIVLSLSLIVVLGFMLYFLKRIPEWVFEQVANRSSFRSEIARITFEHQLKKAAHIVGDSEVTELLNEMAANTVPILSKQERHLRSAISRAIQKGSHSLTDDAVIQKLNEALLETEEVIVAHREFGHQLLRTAASVTTDPEAAHLLHIKLFALKEQLEASQISYQGAFAAAYTAMQPKSRVETAEHHA